MNIEEMRERLEEVRSRLLELADLDELDDDQAREFDELDAEETELRETIQTEERRQATVTRVRQAAARGGHISGDGGDPIGEPRSLDDRDDPKLYDIGEIRSDLASAAADPSAARSLRGRALTAIENVPGVNDRSKQRLTRMVESFDLEDEEEVRAGAARLASHLTVVSSPDYMRSWKKAFRSALTGGMDPDALGVLSRAASLTDAAGGYAVPLPVDPTLIVDDDGTVNPFREIATQRTIVTDQLRTVSAGAVSFSWDGEAGEASDDTPTFANVDITAHKLQAFVPYSIEIGMDYPGFTDDLRMVFAEGRNNAEAAAFATGAGDGSNQPVGIVTALTGGSYEVSSNTTDTFAVGDIYDLEEELPARFRRNGQWVANKRIYQAAREAGGANLDDFWANLGQGQPPELLGYPAHESPDMDGTITGAAENYVLVFGDFRWYWIVDRAGFSLELVPHLFATGNNRPSGQRGLYGWLRVGADSVMDRAFRLLNVT